MASLSGPGFKSEHDSAPPTLADNLRTKLEAHARAHDPEVADRVEVAKPQVFQAQRHSLIELVLEANAVDKPGFGVAFARTYLSEANHVDAAMNFRVHNAQTGRGIEQEARLDQHAGAPANCGNPIDRAGSADHYTGADQAFRNADVGERDVGLDAEDELLRLPVEADLTAADETIGVARPTVAEVHAAIETLPNRRIVRLVEAGRPAGTICGRGNCRRSRPDEQGHRRNAYPEESHVRVLPLVFMPRTGQRNINPHWGRFCGRR